jgi:hypothetical protein
MPGNTTREYWSIGELSKIPLSAGEYWNKNRRLCCFSVLLLPLLHHSITPKNTEITGIINPLWE